MENTVTFAASLGDGGTGRSATFHIADFGLNPALHSSAEIELGVALAYEKWLCALVTPNYYFNA